MWTLSLTYMNYIPLNTAPNRELRKTFYDDVQILTRHSREIFSLSIFIYTFIRISLFVYKKQIILSAIWSSNGCALFRLDGKTEKKKIVCKFNDFLVWWVYLKITHRNLAQLSLQIKKLHVNSMKFVCGEFLKNSPHRSFNWI